jgi:hypothetical protein
VFCVIKREILQRLRDRGNQEQKAAADLQALEESDYNDYSRPRASTVSNDEDEDSDDIDTEDEDAFVPYIAYAFCALF